MKSKIQVILALFFFCFAAFSAVNAQTLELVNAETDVKATPDMGEVKSHASFRNLIFSNVSAKAKIEIVSMAAGHQFSVCTPALCSPLQSKSFTTSAFTVPGAGTIEEKDFYITLVFDEIKGTSSFKVSIFNESNADDKIEYDLVFNVDEINNVTEIMSNNTVVFPNPTSSAAEIRFDEPLAADADFVLYTESGETVKNDKINANSTNYALDLSALSQGSYYYTIVSNGKQISFGKVSLVK